MRVLVIALLLTLFPVLAKAQGVLGAPMYPMLYVDEAELAPATFTTLTYPAAPWNDARACLVTMGYKVPQVRTPDLVVIPKGIATFRTGDMLRDSLFPDATHWTSPTIGYALIKTHRVLIADRYKDSFKVLRHEALHILLWAADRTYGHPEKVFIMCDDARPVPQGG
jgi:hypothetical protein